MAQRMKLSPEARIFLLRVRTECLEIQDELLDEEHKELTAEMEVLHARFEEEKRLRSEWIAKICSEVDINEADLYDKNECVEKKCKEKKFKKVKKN